MQWLLTMQGFKNTDRQSSYMQDGIHQNGGIIVCQMMRKEIEMLWKDEQGKVL